MLQKSEEEELDWTCSKKKKKTVNEPVLSGKIKRIGHASRRNSGERLYNQWDSCLSLLPR